MAQEQLDKVTSIYFQHIFQFIQLYSELSAWCRTLAGSERTKAFQQQLHNFISTLPNTAKVVLETSDASFTNSGRDAVGDAKAASRVLLVKARDRLETLSNESIFVFVMEAKIYKMIQTLKSYRTELQMECAAICKMKDDYEADLNIALSHLEIASCQVWDTAVGLSGIFCLLFVDVGAILQPLRRNHSDQLKNCENLKQKFRHIQELHETELIVIAGLGSLLEALEFIMQRTQNLEHDIITAKEDASDAYRKVSSMEACLGGRLIEVDRKECLRRMLRLLRIDDSAHLWAKNLIHEYYHESLPNDLVKDLEQERRDLELDI